MKQKTNLEEVIAFTLAYCKMWEMQRGKIDDIETPKVLNAWNRSSVFKEFSSKDSLE